MKYWLVLDIGNTHTVAGLYQITPEPRLGCEHAPLISHVRFRTDAQATSDEYRMELSQLFLSSQSGENSAGFTDSEGRLWPLISRVIVSTVVPSLEGVITQACAPIPVLRITSDTKREFDLDLPIPSQLGADRLANVAGAFTLAKPPFLIVDAGTATTFCLVNAHGVYVGGAIVPGLETGWKALQARAARLFSVELVRPINSIGRTTETQLQSGVLLGYEALIEGMTDRLLRDAREVGVQNLDELTLFATGGCISLLKLSSRFHVEPDLTLKGLLRYGELTKE